MFPACTMNLANCVTLLRIPLLLLVVAFMYMSEINIRWCATLSLMLFILCGVTDWLDGYLARTRKIISTLGTFMDALMDKIFMVGVMITLLTFGILPRWSLFLVLIIVGREFLVTAIRLVAATENIIIAASHSGKVKTVIQIVSTGIFILWFALHQDFGVWLRPSWISWIWYGGLILFLYSTYLTISSGAIYVYKYRDLLEK